MLNVEIKAKSTAEQQRMIRQYLADDEDATFKGEDHQIDTYFNVPDGRLKLRVGRIENMLVQYHRSNQEGPKESKYNLVPFVPGTPLKEALVESLGVLVEVNKFREIYYINNVKIHLDEVLGLGQFVEIEARDETETIGRERLLAQCKFYMVQFGIQTEDLISNSYSDMLNEKIPQKKERKDLTKLAKMVNEIIKHKEKYHLSDEGDKLTQSYHRGMIEAYNKIFELMNNRLNFRLED